MPTNVPFKPSHRGVLAVKSLLMTVAMVVMVAGAAGLSILLGGLALAMTESFAAGVLIATVGFFAGLAARRELERFLVPQVFSKKDMKTMDHDLKGKDE